MLHEDELQVHFRLAGGQLRALKRLGIQTVRDLLYHFPTRYINFSDIKTIASLKKGDAAIIYGRISHLKTRKAFRRRTPLGEGILEDESGRIKIMWFHQPYLAKMLEDGALVKVTGKATGSEKNLYIANPEIEKVDVAQTVVRESLFTGDAGTPSIYPVYPETRGITSKWFYHAMSRLLTNELLDAIDDPVPKTLLKRYNLPTLRSALVWIHTPKNEKDALAARKRFAFDEVFSMQLVRQGERRRYQEQKSFRIPVKRSEVNAFIKRFPFRATNAQKRSIGVILDDFGKPHAMSRLLEGDVGSGKTAVAAVTAYAVVKTHPSGQDFGNLQVAYMTPTEILAKQQFASFIENFSHLPINVGLITGSGCMKFPSKVHSDQATTISRSQLLKWVANGEIPILVGTHALIQKTVQFKNLAYVVIDEQHRFGTAQRQNLIRKDGIAPHLLSMTATPIPRTLALTIYGDLDLTLLDEMPAGRKPIITEVVLPNERKQTYEKVRAELASGRQVYVICPRIDEPDPEKELAVLAKSVTKECARLKREVFPDYVLEILHSKMRPKEKEDVMRRFSSGEAHVLVATSVVEVGVNVPNATVIIIEGAERFGLAQLHQLRGRVLRSNHQAYCFVFAETRGKQTIARLNALKTAKSGFELAEQDLGIRGAGELYGRHQSGLSDIGMEAMKNVKMVEAARAEAQELIEKDPMLASHPKLKELVLRKEHDLHFE
ncbi:MAG TPA: ATP-dependent DNA helicase RecG [Candidatus Paceibacterota bacterium]|jgi:ATP-dependent DNA helicase RecG